MGDIYEQQNAQHWTSVHPIPQHIVLLQNLIVSPLQHPTAVFECLFQKDMG